MGSFIGWLLPHPSLVLSQLLCWSVPLLLALNFLILKVVSPSCSAGHP